MNYERYKWQNQVESDQFVGEDLTPDDVVEVQYHNDDLDEEEAESRYDHKALPTALVDRLEQIHVAIVLQGK